MSLIAVASTLASYKMIPPEAGMSWLAHAEALVADAAWHDHEARFFAALEVDARGLEPFTPLLARLDQIGAEVWHFSMDTGTGRLGTKERLAHICTGRNLIAEWAMRARVDWLLHLDSDLRVPGDSVSKLLEATRAGCFAHESYPIVGGHVGAYALDGPAVPQTVDPPLDLRSHMNTAGFLMVHRSLFRVLRWRIDLEAGLTDDPCYAVDAERLGYPTVVRHDLLGEHALLEPLEDRGHDLAVYR